MFLLKIAFRNLFRQKRRSLLTGLVMVVGFFMLSISIGIAEGSYGAIIELFTGSHTGHIQIHRGDYRRRPALHKAVEREWGSRLSRFPFVKSWTPRVYASALAFHGNKAVGAQIMGVDRVREPATSTLWKRVSEGSFTADGAVITDGLARVLNITIGDDLVLISQGADGSIANDIFTISGILESEEEIGGAMVCYLGLEQCQEFLTMGDKVHEIAIITDSYAQAPHYAAMIRQNIADATYDIQPWQVVEKSFYTAMQVDIKGMWVTLAIIMLIVAIGVLDAVLMSLLERTREFGILKALGTRPWLLFRLIVTEISLLTCISIVGGALLSFVAHKLLIVYGIELSEPVKFGGISFTTYRSVLTPNVFWIPASITWLTSIAISIIPAYGMVRKRPVEALRYV